MLNGLPLWQLMPVLALPMFGIFLGTLLNQRASDKLCAEVKDLRGEVRDVRKQMHDEYIGLLNIIGDHAQRIVRIEERGSRSS